MRVRANTNVHDRIVDDRDHQNLTAGKSYIVFEINNDSYRVCNDKAEPILYPKALFTVIDNSIPPGWVMIEFEEDE